MPRTANQIGTRVYNSRTCPARELGPHYFVVAVARSASIARPTGSASVGQENQRHQRHAGQDRPFRPAHFFPCGFFAPPFVDFVTAGLSGNGSAGSGSGGG